MKKSALLIGLVFAFGILANAQSSKQITVHIPFDFYIQNQKLATGNYLIESLSPQSNGAVLIFWEKSGKAKRIVMTIPIGLSRDRKSLEPTIRFNRYGNDYFLSEIRNPLEELGFAVRPTKVQRQLAKKFGKPTKETVAMNLVKK